jgi:hypothetical protein
VNGSLPTDNATYVAYLFAHDAGGFGDAGTDSVISCGSYTGNGSTSGPTVIDLGWEPQWLLIKRASGGTGGWFLLDSMRGIATGSADASLQAESANAENTADDRLSLTSTGFQLTTTSSFFNNSGDTYIYIAIRRGPMKTPTVGTEVFSAVAFTGNNSPSQVISVGFPADIILGRERTTTGNTVSQWPLGTRMLGNGYLRTTQTAAEVAFLDMVNGWDDQNSIDLGDIMVGNSSLAQILYSFRRAPGFFDVVAYTGTGVARTVPHNLGVAPELMIVKGRSNTQGWQVYVQPLGNSLALVSKLDITAGSVNIWNNTNSNIFCLHGKNIY